MEKDILKNKVISALKLVYDPEIPVDVYELGLIYNIEVDSDNIVQITMTLTSPNCPVADSIVQEVYLKVQEIPEVKDVDINLTFEPSWDADMASEVAQLQLGML